MSFIIENFESLTGTEQDIQRLKGLVLDLAIKGKLIQQNKKDKPAIFLLKAIEKRKEDLIAEKKIRKQKPSARIEEKEKTFIIPHNWKWTRINSICEVVTDGAHHTPKYISKGVPFLSVKDISKGEINFSSCRYISKESHEKLILRCHPEFEDLLLTKVGTTGIAKVIDTRREFSIFVSVALLKFSKKEIYPYFLEHLINSPYIKAKSAKNTKGVGNKNLVLRDIKNFAIPIPPYEEQKRIAQKINSLFQKIDALAQHAETAQITQQRLRTALLNRLDNAANHQQLQQEWQSLTPQFETVFDSMEGIKALRKSILQLAVKGKLVSQNSADEPASALLERIKVEKERLIREKVIRKQKELPIKSKELYYDIPEGWTWVILSDLGRFTGGGTPSKHRPEYWDGDILWVSSKDLKSKYIVDTHLKITQEGIDNSSANLIPVNSLLIGARSGILRRLLPVCINSKECTVNQDIKVLIPYLPFLHEYIQLMLKGFEGFILKELVKQGTTVESLKYKEFQNHPFPFPPLAEQKHIVQKVSQLMAWCDELEERITKRTEVKERLLSKALVIN